MKLRHRIGALVMVPIILVVMSLSPFEKKVYAEPITIGAITLILSILSACGVTVNFLMSDVFPKTGGFDPGVLDNPLSTAEERLATMAELEKLNVPNSNFAKMALDKVGEKLKPFTDKISQMTSHLTLSGIAATIGIGVAELLNRAKTGTLELTQEQTIAMQKFMTENFSEVMAGNIKVLNGTSVSFNDIMITYQPFPMKIGTPAKTNYYTNIRTNQYFCIEFILPPVGSDFKCFFSLAPFYRIENGVFKKFSEISSSLSYNDFPNDFGSLYYKFGFDKYDRFEVSFYNTLNFVHPDTAPRAVSKFTADEYNFIPWVASDSVLVSTDAPTLTATGSLQFPQTDLPLTLPNTLTGGVSIPISQNMDMVNEKALADAIARAGGIDVPGEIPPIPPVIPPDIPDFMMPGSIINKFPFSIPFDLYKGAKLLVAPPVTPKFDVSFSFPFRNSLFGDKYIPLKFTIDLTPFDKVAALCRTLSVIVFTAGLAIATPRIVKGAK